MRLNKIIAFSLMLFVLLISVTAISAADLNETNTVMDDVLKENNVKDNTFQDLKGDISLSKQKLNLDKDYKFNKTTDVHYTGGINIKTYSYEINGNNHVIDCDNQARAFNYTGKGTLTIKNLIIKNGLRDTGSALVSSGPLILNNVTFINCNSNGTSEDAKCGAVFVMGSEVQITNCKFIDNSGEDGAAISAYSCKLTINKCTFTSNSNKTIKGQVYLNEAIATISNSIFLNSTSRYSTAIFAEEGSSLKISKSKFTNLKANRTAGAISFKESKLLTIDSCEFNNVTSANNGGAVFADIIGENYAIKNGRVIIKGTVFNNCYSGFGGAILQIGGKLSISKTDFTSNIAEYDGGAIYTSFANVGISNSIFKSNTLLDDISYGGACYFDMGNVTLKNNIFHNNRGNSVSTLYAYDTNLALQSNYFNNPSNLPSIYTVYGKIKLNKGNTYNKDKRSFNNKNAFYNFKNTAKPLQTIDVTYADAKAKRFDLREYGWVTPVKNQGFMGSCWAYGNFAALESSLLRYTNRTYALSVNNAQNIGLQYSKYGTIGAPEGADEFTAWSYLTSWLGGFPEEYEEYDELGKISPLYMTPDDFHIYDVVIIPESKKPKDNMMLIKEALVKYGAVAVNHNADFNEDKYFNTAKNAQYYNGKNATNHRVGIVGWDDTYSRNNFLITPPGDGAWIVKNSWGDEWGDQGYFYISYYDTSVAKDAPSVAYVITNETYDRIYQNDIGGSNSLNKKAKVYYNQYKATEDSMIAAVGTQFEKAGMYYEFGITVNDVLVLSQKGNAKYGGYETIQLNKLVQLKKGDTFRVIFKNTMYTAIDTRIHVQPGKSFASPDGKTWQDLSTINAIAVLKAYTVKDLKVTKNMVKYYKNTAPFVAKVGAGQKVTFVFNKKKYVRTAGADGLAKLNINAKTGKYSITTVFNKTKIASYIIIKSTVVSKNVVRGYNSNFNYKFRIVTPDGKPVAKTKVAISINGKRQTRTTDASGYVTIKFTKLTKMQKISVKNPKTKEVRRTTIKIASRFSGSKNIKMYYYDGTAFKAKILGNNAKAVGKNQIVVVKFNKKTYKLKTNAKGIVFLRIPDTATPGTYKLTASYKGQTIKRTVKVLQVLKTSKRVVKKSAKKLTLTASVKVGKDPVPNMKILLTLNGKEYLAKTNKNGIVSFTLNKNIISKLQAGKTYRMAFTLNRNVVKTTLKVI